MNKTKKEVVCPRCLGDDADAVDWSPNTLGAILALHLQTSEHSDSDDGEELVLKIDPSIAEQFAHTMSRGVPKPLGLIERDLNSIVGRWSGDDVYLVSDRDRSEYQESFGYRNVSQELASAWNMLTDDKDMHLQYQPECVCTPVAAGKV